MRERTEDFEMHKTLVKKMRLNPFERRHFSDAQQRDKVLRVITSNVKIWGESNSRYLAYINELLIDVRDYHGSLQEVMDEVQALQRMMENQGRELNEAIDA